MHVFVSPRLKLKRAYKHIEELVSITEPLSKELYEVKVEPISEPSKPVVRSKLVYRPTQPVAESIGLIIGDVINNFRSALDHMASGIVREQYSKKSPYFPMSVTREELADNKYLPVLDKALPGSRALILDTIRPEGNPDNAYWAFHKLDNDSKHNVILPTVSALSIDNINLVSSGNRMTNYGVGGDATRQIDILHSDAPILIQKTYTVSIEMKFPMDSELSGQPVIESLRKIGDIVTSTIDEFEKLYVSTK
ncbi:TPA: hypothetical protein NJ539_002685 [Vibrio parahaemolyticus]|nr:hypothetical protein [Vibrio parahaemolyticus]